jgi:hypothetical protein
MIYLVGSLILCIALGFKRGYNLPAVFRYFFNLIVNGGN